MFLSWNPGLRLAWCLVLTFFALLCGCPKLCWQDAGMGRWDNPEIGGFGGRTGTEQVQIRRLGRNADLKGQRVWRVRWTAKRRSKRRNGGGEWTPCWVVDGGWSGDGLGPFFLLAFPLRFCFRAPVLPLCGVVYFFGTPGALNRGSERRGDAACFTCTRASELGVSPTL